MSSQDVLQQITDAGYLEYFQSYVEVPARRAVIGFVKPGVVAKLKLDDRFCSGPWHLLHADVGEPRCEFRSHTGKLGKGSVQWVINTETGACYCDIDRFSPYSDLVGLVGHAGEVVGGWFKRRRKQEAA